MLLRLLEVLLGLLEVLLGFLELLLELLEAYGCEYASSWRA